MTAAPALAARNLRLCLRSGDAIVEETDLCLEAGDILGLVGESGSGKTTTALALLGYTAGGVEICAGTLEINGARLKMDESMRASRGSLISYVPQNPGRALNPSLRIIDAIEDVLRAHEPSRVGTAAAYALLEAVGLSATPEFGRRYPHQLSGGQQQRVCIALALACEPAVVVLDEPTTGLDVITQDKILRELARLRDERGVAMVYVTHDLAAVSQIASRIAVMYAGRVVEQGSAEQVLRRPRHPYTRGLLASIPDHVRPRGLEPMPGIAVGVGERPDGCAFGPRCPQRTDPCTLGIPPLEDVGEAHLVRCFNWNKTPSVRTVPLERLGHATAEAREAVLQVQDLAAEYGSHRGRVLAATGINFTLQRGACVALVGESGSGKTTTARVIAGLHEIADGRILLHGQELPGPAQRRSVSQRRMIQLISQNPADSLNPRQTVRDAIERPARLLRKLDKRAARLEVDGLLQQVRLPSRLATRYPTELSGGERQRVAIARALAAGPEVLLCDEITSALDVSVQAAVLQLLQDLRRDLSLSILFITHDLGVVATIADEVLVLEAGRTCEHGSTAQVLQRPTNAYTKRLLEAAPSVASAIGDTDLADAH